MVAFCPVQVPISSSPLFPCLPGLLPWVKLVSTFEAQYSYITNEGSVFTFRTNLDAPRYRVINVDVEKPDRSLWAELLPQHDKDVLGRNAVR